MPSNFQAYPRLPDMNSTSPFHSANPHPPPVLGDTRMPGYTSLADISLSSGHSTSIDLDGHHGSHSESFVEQAYAHDQGTVATNQGVSQIIDKYDMSVDVNRSPAPPFMANNHSMPTAYDADLLQVPMPPMKRRKTTENYQCKDPQTMERKRKMPANTNVIHYAGPENPKETHSPKSRDRIQAIRDVAKSYSGTSEDVLSFRTQVLNLLDEGGPNEHQRVQDPLVEVESDIKKKSFECDFCHKKVARQCDLKYECLLMPKVPN